MLGEGLLPEDKQPVVASVPMTLSRSYPVAANGRFQVSRTEHLAQWHGADADRRIYVVVSSIITISCAMQESRVGRYGVSRQLRWGAPLPGELIERQELSFQLNYIYQLWAI